MPLHATVATDPKFKKALAYWTNNPVEAVKDWFACTPDDYQGDILNALCKPQSLFNRVAAKSGHGVGKTATESWAGWHFLITRALCKVVATAPTANQLADILWPEFTKWRLKMPEELSSMWDVSATHLRHKGYPKNWFATARTSNKPDNMQGFHEDHILVICEEASGIAQNIYEVIEGILSNAEEEGQEARLLMVGNPTTTAGEFYNAFNKHKGLYHRFTISGDATTQADKGAGQFYVSKRVSQKYRDTMASKYGKDGPVYDVRVRGLFPRMADDVVIPLAWAEGAQGVVVGNLDAIADGVTLVMDVARFGGDETTLAVFRRGHCLKLNTWPKTSTVECADILYEASQGAFGVGSLPLIRCIVDEPGVGGGVVDLGRRYGLPITPYHGQAKMVEGLDREEDFRMFANRRSRDWWHLRRKMEMGKIHIPEDEDLVNQLASVKYDYYNEKIKVESKKDMRERLGEDASPDRADTIVMGAAPTLGAHSTVPLEALMADNSILYGDDRATANQDF